MKLTSCWLNTAPQFSGASNEPVAGKADRVVIGAGLTAASAALALAKKGARVVVCEVRDRLH